jgi:integrase
MGQKVGPMGGMRRKLKDDQPVLIYGLSVDVERPTRLRHPDAILASVYRIRFSPRRMRSTCANIVPQCPVCTMKPTKSKQRTRQRYEPYRVTIKGRPLWQVSLDSQTIRKPDGTKARLRPRRTFTSLEEAKTFADLKRIERRNRGALGVSMPEKLRVDALEAARILEPYDISLTELARQYATKRELSAKSVTIAEAVPALLKSKALEQLRPQYLEDLAFRLGKFRQAFADRKAAELESGELHGWLESLGQSPLSRNVYHAQLSLLFNYCRTRGWAAANPVTLIPRTKVSRSGSIGILTPEQAARLLETASEETLPFWAISLFAGLRSAEIERLDWANIHWNAQLIEVPALKSKTATRRFVVIQPNLARWLGPCQKRSGPIITGHRFGRLTLERKAAGLAKWPPNACRHSFASYHLAHFGDLQRLMAEMGHTNPDVTFRHYRELTTPEQAERFWRIAPAIEGAEKLLAIA